MDKKAYDKYDRAKKRVKEIRGFYTHLRIFVIVNMLVYLFRFVVLPKIGALPEDEGFENWLNWNTYLMPLLWGLGLGIHYLRVFSGNWKPIRKWEERKIEEFLKNDEIENAEE